MHSALSISTSECDASAQIRRVFNGIFTIQSENISHVWDRLVCRNSPFCYTVWTKQYVLRFRYIRVWIEGIMESIIELRHGFEAIHCAAWCPSNATVIACVTRSRLILWDIKTNSLRPAAEHNIKDLNGDDEITVFQFTNCGRSLVIGTESGVTLVYALEDMPFAPHFQYKALELAIFKNLASKPDLEPQVRRLGYLGYSKTNSTNTMDDA